MDRTQRVEPGQGAGSAEVVGRNTGVVLSRRSMLRLLGVSAAGVALGACSTQAESPNGDGSTAGGTEATPTEGQASEVTDAFLRMVGDQRQAGLDPRTSVGFTGLMLKYNVFKTLTTYDASTGESEPLLASELPTREDATTWLVRIRSGEKWHDGTDLTASDVKYTLDWMLDPDNGSLFRSSVLDVFDSVELVDEHTVRLHLNRESGSVVERLSRIAPVPQAYAEQVGKDQFELEPLGCGPFVFADHVTDDFTEISRWEDYQYEPAPKLAGARLSRIVEGSARLNALRGDQAEVDLSVDPQLYGVAESAGLVPRSFDTAGYKNILLNNGSEPFNDKRVRLALAHSIDREALASQAWNGLATPQVGPLPPTHNMTADLVAPEYDPERARALLEEAGKLGIEIELQQKIENQAVAMATIIQQQLEEGGFKVNIKIGESSGLNQSMFDGTYQAYSTSGNTAIVGEYAYLYALWVERSVFNHASEEELAPLMDALEQADRIPASQREEQAAAYAAIQQLIVDDARNIYLLSVPLLTAATPEVEGLTIGMDAMPSDLASVSLSA